MLTDTDLEDLRVAVRGPVSFPGDPGYDTDTMTVNPTLMHHPEAVLGAAGATDVQAAVRWAGERGIPLAVQATGHSVSSPMEEGLLINTSRLQDVVINPDDGTATVGAGVRWRTLLQQTVPLGLTGAHGSSGTVGIVGYSAGGGLPVMGRALGFGSDHVRSIEVVTPDGRMRHVESEGDDAELFTLLRGGKGNFGIITAMTHELTPFQDFYGGGLMYPEAAGPEVLQAFLDWTAQLPSDASASLAFLHLPDVPFLPEELRGTAPVHVRFALFGSREEGDLLIEPMRRVSVPFMDTTGPMDYSGIGSIHMDPDGPMPTMERGALLSSLPTAELLEQVGPGSDTPLMMTEIRLMGGAMDTEPDIEDVVPGRGSAFHLFTVGLNAPPVADATASAMERLSAATAAYSTGTMVNMHGPAGDPRDRRRAWAPAAFERLQEAKAVYDPQNLFRFGHAVPLPEPGTSMQ
ncbi:FAD-binding oxidoreductase [Arthrobacter sp. zg-Y40]|uniref:FAD-binding oxidoreductase n=1 Tax=Arthrobacter sp. zg-Y40 TaxID=2886939 RepID=UPI001D13673B|nr:FAD-binding oxidoreductase [Arthrobacter sp. zg-Y40]MCC3278477.1 FAD-binding oxidoreductase [Arthrobacter sp. zg-Y40]